jgi:hypothetical protein
MTEHQHAIFKIILDLNWDYEHETDPIEKDEIGKLLREKKLELRIEMGEEAYEDFMEQGRQMFAPKE